MIYITRKAEFSASHRLANPDLSEEENRSLYKDCYNLHGHNYLLEVTVRGDAPVQTGMVVDFKDLKAILRDEILDRVDHKDLNTQVPFLEGVNPTAENLAVKFWELLEAPIRKHQGVELHKIRIHETRDCYVDYCGPRSGA